MHPPLPHTHTLSLSHSLSWFSFSLLLSLVQHFSLSLSSIPAIRDEREKEEKQKLKRTQARRNHRQRTWCETHRPSPERTHCYSWLSLSSIEAWRALAWVPCNETEVEIRGGGSGGFGGFRSMVWVEFQIVGLQIDGLLIVRFQIVEFCVGLSWFCVGFLER